MPTLRVLSVDARAVRRDRPALARLISGADPHLVCVHNGPHLGRWRQKAAALARRSGLVVVAAGGRASGANLLFSTLAVDSSLTHAVRFDGGGTNPPGAALALMRSDGREFVLVGSTFAGNAAERLGQARQLQAAIDRFVPSDPPCVVSALGTDRPGTAAWQSLAERRLAVGGRYFVDERISVHDARDVPGMPGVPAVLAELEI